MVSNVPNDIEKYEKLWNELPDVPNGENASEDCFVPGLEKLLVKLRDSHVENYRKINETQSRFEKLKSRASDSAQPACEIIPLQVESKEEEKRN